MKQKRKIILILCVFILTFGLSSCTLRKNKGDNTAQNTPAASAVEAASPAPVQNPPAASTVEIASPAPVQDAGRTEASSPGVNQDFTLPEIEIPVVPSGSGSGVQNNPGNGGQPAAETPQAGDSGSTDYTGPEVEQPEPYDQGPEQGSRIVITDGGDILLPELP